MNTAAAAAQAAVTIPTIRGWCRTGAVAAVKRAGRWVIDAASLAARIAIGKMRTRTAPEGADRTGELAGEIAMQTYEAAEYRSTAALRQILADLVARDTQRIAGIPAREVHLTDAGWAELERSVRLQISCIGAEH